MLHNYFQDIAEEGLLAEFKFLDDSDEFFWVPPGYTSAISYDSVRIILESRAAGYEYIKFDWESLKINPLNTSYAAYTGVVRGMMKDTAGVEADVALIETGVVVKRDAGWKLLCGQSRALE